ncbi:guanylate-binding protein 4-like isoform X1 [Chelonoidis abingdonii]|uniref:guanylate-binding protein 4-like isoform X1 n=1 Tax=Chelonoidis abingdonii TaxID=106734 RepID=UPI003F491F2D
MLSKHPGPSYSKGTHRTSTPWSKLHFVSELTEHIKVKAQRGDDAEEDTEFVRFFPSFVWAVRDFTLELRIEGQLVTEDQYLEHALALRKGNSKKVMDYNLPRQCIRSFFPIRKCFVFVQPVSRQEMGQLDSLPTSALDPQFLEQTRRFCDYVFQCSNVKTVKGGILVSGRRFGALVRSYVDTIRSGQVPCLDNAVTAMAAIENEAALREALAHYAAGMAGLQLPAELGELSVAHGMCEADALRLFMQLSFKDEEQGFQKRLVAGITERYANILAENEAVSEQTCRVLLDELSAAMQQKLSAGLYSQPGGYQAYDRDQNQVVENYRAKPNKGVKAEEALEQFLASKKAEAEAVLKADNLLTEAEKHVAGETPQTSPCPLFFAAEPVSIAAACLCSAWRRGALGRDCGSWLLWPCRLQIIPGSHAAERLSAKLIAPTRSFLHPPPQQTPWVPPPSPFYFRDSLQPPAPPPMPGALNAPHSPFPQGSVGPCHGVWGSQGPAPPLPAIPQGSQPARKAGLFR